MGVLDDAIRDHLELKRRHGSDPVEIARLEREALGPVTAAELEADLDWQDEPEDAPAPTQGAFDQQAEAYEPPPTQAWSVTDAPSAPDAPAPAPASEAAVPPPPPP
ncbi:hypothetical protein ACVU7I_14455, partial [Patulibacter sp. S7RM1-6]